MRLLLAPLVAAAVLASAAAATVPAPAGVIVFERRSGTAVADIYSVRPDGSGLRRLTRTQNSFDPDVSPDGRFVVFSSHRAHGPGATELFVMRVDGRGVRRLTRNAHSRTAFTNDSDPAWSPDGRTIAFSRTVVRGGRSSTDIFTVSARGGAPRRLTHAPATEVAPTFTPAGELAFVRGGFIHVRAGGAEVRRQAGADPDWARSHPYPAWGRNGTVLRSTARGEARVGRGSDPAWSPNGKRLTWVTPGGLVVDGKRITRTPGLVHDVSPSWARS